MLQFKSMENIFPLTCMFIAPIYMLLVSLLKKGPVFVLNSKAQVIGFYNTINDTDTLKPK